MSPVHCQTDGRVCCLFLLERIKHDYYNEHKTRKRRNKKCLKHEENLSFLHRSPHGWWSMSWLYTTRYSQPELLQISPFLLHWKICELNILSSNYLLISYPAIWQKCVLSASCSRETDQSLLFLQSRPSRLSGRLHSPVWSVYFTDTALPPILYRTILPPPAKILSWHSHCSWSL